VQGAGVEGEWRPLIDAGQRTDRLKGLGLLCKQP